MCEGVTGDQTTVIINPDGSVYPFVEVLNSGEDSDDELRDMILDYLEKKGRKLGTFYKTV